MSNNIKPSEVSEVLLRQLHDMSNDAMFEEVGVVLSIGDGVAHIYGLTHVTENELVEFENGVMAVAMNLEEDNVGVVLLGSSEGIKEGQSVKRTGKVASIEVNEQMLGRVSRRKFFFHVFVHHLFVFLHLVCLHIYFVYPSAHCG